MRYRAEKFASLSDTDVGRRLWAFLTRPETIARLATATELGRPAVEGIEEPLLEEFGDEVMADRVRQMIGHMVRQVMEAEGFVLDQAEVKIRSVPFAKAARYTRPGWFTFHAFRNAEDARDVAVADRRDGASLPDDARWIHYASFASPLKAVVAFGIRDPAELRRAIAAHGHARVRVERILRSARPTPRA
jgi:hypothetical protein